MDGNAGAEAAALWRTLACYTAGGAAGFCAVRVLRCAAGYRNAYVLSAGEGAVPYTGDQPDDSADRALPHFYNVVWLYAVEQGGGGLSDCFFSGRHRHL
ncbi:hypothetical protein D3C75_1112390 [compost metagenome]